MRVKAGDNFFKKIWSYLLLVGPGIFCIGYTIGTGSVTSMEKAGSVYDMQLLWVLLLSVFFAWILMEVYGKYTIVTGETAIMAFKNRLPLGKTWAILVIIGVVAGQWSALSGIIGFISNGFYEIFRLFLPNLHEANYWAVLGLAAILELLMFSILLIGRYSFFEKLLILFVTLMGISFVVSMFIVLPPVKDIAKGFVPSISKGDSLMVAAFVGTTMAAPTFVVRSLIVKEKGWHISDIRLQSFDAKISAAMMFIISGSIMAASAGAFFNSGGTITKVLDLAYALEPVAGRFAVGLFIVGALSAGLSSVFPILMVAPLLIGDYREGKMDTRSNVYKTLVAIACVFGLIVPILGSNPIMAQIVSQVTNVFVLPLVIAGIMILVNNKKLMHQYAIGFWTNMALGLAFIFSLIISYTGIQSLIGLY